MNKKIDIDFKILLKKMCTELTESQQLIFEQWTSQSGRNQRYFEIYLDILRKVQT